jgi:hypothetical protein
VPIVSAFLCPMWVAFGKSAYVSRHCIVCSMKSGTEEALFVKGVNELGFVLPHSSDLDTFRYEWSTRIYRSNYYEFCEYRLNATRTLFGDVADVLCVVFTICCPTCVKFVVRYLRKTLFRGNRCRKI